MADDEALKGAQDQGTDSSTLNLMEFVVERVLARTHTMTLVRVEKNTNEPGSLSAIGRVDVLPLVNQLDGNGKAVKHEVVNGLSYFRYQGGRNAIISDPEQGDVGLAIFAERDISAVKRTGGKQSNPGSNRRFDMADGIFIGLCLAESPQQYIRFLPDGIEIADKNGNKMRMGPDGIRFTSTELSNTGEIRRGKGGTDEVTLGQHKHPTTPDGPKSPPEPGT
jgi:hypothetical protein